MSTTTELTVLLAEDDDGHASLVQRNLKRIGIANPVLRFRDGAALLEYTAGLDEGTARAHLVLMDIRMPGIDGVETLRRIRANPSISSMPVIMLSTTDDPHEIRRCHELGCSNYIVKPVEYTAFVEAIRSLGLFLLVVSVPSTPVRQEGAHA